MSKKAFQTLRECRETIEELPLEKWQRELHRNLNVIRDMLVANREDPEKLKQQIEVLSGDIEATLDYLQRISSSAISDPGSPFSPWNPWDSDS